MTKGEAMFTGCGTALVTPFRRDGSLDEEALRRTVRRQIEGGIRFLVPCGTTGENPVLDRDEHLRVIAITVEEAGGRVPVIGGAGGNNTREVIELARQVEALGVQGLLAVTGYYNKPTPEGLYQHYKALGEAVHTPIIVYNVPGRTGINIDPATLARIAELPNIHAVKESSGNLPQIASICARGGIRVLSGDDAMSLGTIAHGGVGLVSVASNVDPARMSAMVDAALAGDLAKARDLFNQLLPLMDVLFVESNPIPVKSAMAMMGLLEPVHRLPLVPAKSETLAKIEAVLRKLELLEQAHARG